MMADISAPLPLLGVSGGMLPPLLLLSAALSLPPQAAMARTHILLPGKPDLFQPYLGPTGHTFDHGGHLLGIYSKFLKPSVQRWPKGQDQTVLRFLQLRRDQRNAAKASTWK